MEEPTDYFEAAKAVLDMNDQGSYTVPAEGLYPHQWLWDSCFISMGWRHIDVERAKTEILTMLSGQWSNGMIPHIVLNQDVHARDRNIWRSWLNPFSPDGVNTSGITQPPIIAEAVVQIGKKLSLPERRTWYKTVYRSLVDYHEWLYKDRDPHNEGLVLQVHPWETGLDNTPPWMGELHEHQLAWWISLIEKLHLQKFVNLFRRDTKRIPAAQRMNIIEALALFNIQRRLRRKRYDINRILTHSLFAIEDLTFNCILIRANQHLVDIAKTAGLELPDSLIKSMSKTETALEQLWDPYSSQYYSRNFITHKALKDSSIATLMPLYAGTISKERAKTLVGMLENQHLFGPAYPVPSVPINSPWFKPDGYWQGPTWINANWLIIDGLKRMEFKEHAAALKKSTIELVKMSGCNEYFNPLTGEPEGASNFSWTAALFIDLVKK